jgi:hypothetical protein
MLVREYKLPVVRKDEWTRTLEEIRLEVDLEYITTESFDGIVERQYVDTFAIFDVKTLMNIDEVTEFHPQVVASHFVHLDSTFVDVIRAEADENGISSFLASEFIDAKVRTPSPRQNMSLTEQ